MTERHTTPRRGDTHAAGGGRGSTPHHASATTASATTTTTNSTASATTPRARIRFGDRLIATMRPFATSDLGAAVKEAVYSGHLATNGAARATFPGAHLFSQGRSESGSPLAFIASGELSGEQISQVHDYLASQRVQAARTPQAELEHNVASRRYNSRMMAALEVGRPTARGAIAGLVFGDGGYEEERNPFSPQARYLDPPINLDFDGELEVGPLKSYVNPQYVPRYGSSSNSNSGEQNEKSHETAYNSDEDDEGDYGVSDASSEVLLGLKSSDKGKRNVHITSESHTDEDISSNQKTNRENPFQYSRKSSTLSNRSSSGIKLERGSSGSSSSLSMRPPRTLLSDSILKCDPNEFTEAVVVNDNFSNNSSKSSDSIRGGVLGDRRQSISVSMMSSRTANTSATGGSTRYHHQRQSPLRTTMTPTRITKMNQSTPTRNRSGSKITQTLIDMQLSNNVLGYTSMVDSDSENLKFYSNGITPKRRPASSSSHSSGSISWASTKQVLGATPDLGTRKRNQSLRRPPGYPESNVNIKTPLKKKKKEEKIVDYIKNNDIGSSPILGLPTYRRTSEDVLTSGDSTPGSRGVKRMNFNVIEASPEPAGSSSQDTNRTGASSNGTTGSQLLLSQSHTLADITPTATALKPKTKRLIDVHGAVENDVNDRYNEDISPMSSPYRMNTPSKKRKMLIREIEPSLEETVTGEFNVLSMSPPDSGVKKGMSSSSELENRSGLLRTPCKVRTVGVSPFKRHQMIVVASDDENEEDEDTDDESGIAQVKDLEALIESPTRKAPTASIANKHYNDEGLTVVIPDSAREMAAGNDGLHVDLHLSDVDDDDDVVEKEDVLQPRMTMDENMVFIKLSNLQSEESSRLNELRSFSVKSKSGRPVYVYAPGLKNPVIAGQPIFIEDISESGAETVNSVLDSSRIDHPSSDSFAEDSFHDQDNMDKLLLEDLLKRRSSNVKGMNDQGMYLRALDVSSSNVLSNITENGTLPGSNPHSTHGVFNDSFVTSIRDRVDRELFSRFKFIDSVLTPLENISNEGAYDRKYHALRKILMLGQGPQSKIPRSRIINQVPRSVQQASRYSKFVRRTKPLVAYEAKSGSKGGPDSHVYFARRGYPTLNGFHRKGMLKTSSKAVVSIDYLLSRSGVKVHKGMHNKIETIMDSHPNLNSGRTPGSNLLRTINDRRLAMIKTKLQKEAIRSKIMLSFRDVVKSSGASNVDGRNLDVWEDIDSPPQEEESTNDRNNSLTHLQNATLSNNGILLSNTNTSNNDNQDEATGLLTKMRNDKSIHSAIATLCVALGVTVPVAYSILRRGGARTVLEQGNADTSNMNLGNLSSCSSTISFTGATMRPGSDPFSLTGMIDNISGLTDGTISNLRTSNSVDLISELIKDGRKLLLDVDSNPVEGSKDGLNPLAINYGSISTPSRDTNSINNSSALKNTIDVLEGFKDFIRPEIPQQPVKVLDGPGLKNDYYTDVIAWSKLGLLCVALGQTAYIWDSVSQQVKQIFNVNDPIVRSNGENVTDKELSDLDYISSCSFSSDGRHLCITTDSGRFIIFRAIHSSAKHSKAELNSQKNSSLLNDSSNYRVISSESKRRVAQMALSFIRNSRNKQFSKDIINKLEQNVTNYQREATGLAMDRGGSYESYESSTASLDTFEGDHVREKIFQSFVNEDKENDEGRNSELTTSEHATEGNNKDEEGIEASKFTFSQVFGSLIPTAITASCWTQSPFRVLPVPRITTIDDDNYQDDSLYFDTEASYTLQNKMNSDKEISLSEKEIGNSLSTPWDILSIGLVTGEIRCYQMNEVFHAQRLEYATRYKEVNRESLHNTDIHVPLLEPIRIFASTMNIEELSPFDFQLNLLDDTEVTSQGQNIYKYNNPDSDRGSNASIQEEDEEFDYDLTEEEVNERMQRRTAARNARAVAETIEKGLLGGTPTEDTDTTPKKEPKNVKKIRWNKHEQLPIRGGHRDRIVGLSWSPDGLTLASGGIDGKVCLWDIVPAIVARSHRGVGTPTGPEPTTGEKHMDSVYFTRQSAIPVILYHREGDGYDLDCLYDGVVNNYPNDVFIVPTNCITYSPRTIIQDHHGSIRALSWSSPYLSSELETSSRLPANLHVDEDNFLCHNRVTKSLLATGGGMTDQFIRVFDAHGNLLAKRKTKSQICKLQWGPGPMIAPEETTKGRHSSKQEKVKLTKFGHGCMRYAFELFVTMFNFQNPSLVVIELDLSTSLTDANMGITKWENVPWKYVKPKGKGFNIDDGEFVYSYDGKGFNSSVITVEDPLVDVDMDQVANNRKLLTGDEQFNVEFEYMEEELVVEEVDDPSQVNDAIEVIDDDSDSLYRTEDENEEIHGEDEDDDIDVHYSHYQDALNESTFLPLRTPSSTMNNLNELTRKPLLSEQRVSHMDEHDNNKNNKNNTSNTASEYKTPLDSPTLASHEGNQFEEEEFGRQYIENSDRESTSTSSSSFNGFHTSEADEPTEIMGTPERRYLNPPQSAFINGVNPLMAPHKKHARLIEVSDDTSTVSVDTFEGMSMSPPPVRSYLGNHNQHQRVMKRIWVTKKKIVPFSIEYLDPVLINLRANNENPLYDIGTLSYIGKIRDGHRKRPLSASQSPCGEFIVTGGADESIKFWKLWPDAKRHAPTNTVWSLPQLASSIVGNAHFDVFVETNNENEKEEYVKLSTKYSDKIQRLGYPLVWKQLLLNVAELASEKKWTYTEGEAQQIEEFLSLPSTPYSTVKSRRKILRKKMTIKMMEAAVEELNKGTANGNDRKGKGALYTISGHERPSEEINAWLKSMVNH